METDSRGGDFAHYAKRRGLPDYAHNLNHVIMRRAQTGARPQATAVNI
jgi:hypothetical protein